ncbi:hypothetical protein [Grimontia marina]|uniref:hypothetical protein n=1 Tax=Grimontia marina TaxID=646534 RepID=UPI0012FB3F16|nr:hypothetical protein [Grimontia marina]
MHDTSQFAPREEINAPTSSSNLTESHLRLPESVLPEKAPAMRGRLPQIGSKHGP